MSNEEEIKRRLLEEQKKREAEIKRKLEEQRQREKEKNQSPGTRDKGRPTEEPPKK
jgi:hypothetical protein